MAPVPRFFSFTLSRIVKALAADASSEELDLIPIGQCYLNRIVLFLWNRCSTVFREEVVYF